MNVYELKSNPINNIWVESNGATKLEVMKMAKYFNEALYTKIIILNIADRILIHIVITIYSLKYYIRYIYVL